jgi:hypothetical protein
MKARGISRLVVVVVVDVIAVFFVFFFFASIAFSSILEPSCVCMFVQVIYSLLADSLMDGITLITLWLEYVTGIGQAFNCKLYL